jgi:hypothetical protein
VSVLHSAAWTVCAFARRCYAAIIVNAQTGRKMKFVHGEYFLYLEFYCFQRSLHFITLRRCQNRPFHKRKAAKLKPKWEGERGWGLMANEDISDGSFVLEYTGEGEAY